MKDVFVYSEKLWYRQTDGQTGTNQTDLLEQLSGVKASGERQNIVSCTEATPSECLVRYSCVSS